MVMSELSSNIIEMHGNNQGILSKYFSLEDVMALFHCKKTISMKQASLVNHSLTLNSSAPGLMETNEVNVFD